MDVCETDVAIVGLGALGSAVLYHLSILSKAQGNQDTTGTRILGIDAHSPPHRQGSHHGDTRITRLANGEGECYIPFAKRAHVLWHELEKRTGQKLFEQRGVLVFGDPNSNAAMHGQSGFLRRTCALARVHGIEHELLGTEALQERFPGFRHRAYDQGYFEPEGGLLFPENIIQTHLNQAKKLGAKLLFDEAVIDWQLTKHGVRLITSAQEINCKQVIFCAGAQVARFLPPQFSESFNVYRQVLIWLSTPKGSSFRGDDMPPFIRLGDEHHTSGGATDPLGEFYGFPVLRADHVQGHTVIEGLKIGIEQVVRPSADGTRLAPPSEIETLEIVEQLKPYLDWDTAVDPDCIASAACHYTMTNDSHFRMGFLPESSDRVYVASACSGHGFKHCASLGEAIAQKILLGQSDLSLAPFSFT